MHIHKQIQVNHTIIYVFLYIHKCKCTTFYLLVRAKCLWHLDLFFMGEGVFFSGCVLVWKVDCHYFTFHLDTGQLPFHANWGAGGVLKTKSSQVPNMFPQKNPNSTSLLSHMLWQMLSSFHLYRWAKRKELYTSK